MSRDDLTHFRIDGEKRRLIDASRGIWNPSDLHATLSILSTPDSPYEDEDIGGSLFRYAYRAGSIQGDNRKLRRAVELELPVILLRRVDVGKTRRFVPVCPVYVVADDLPNRQFILALDPSLRAVADPLHLEPIERAYAQRVQRQRLHQPEFRGRVLLAYQNRCAVCSLGHARLLDAAHIIRDGDEHGTPDVDNGLSLCKLHHTAYDANLLGISPKYRVHISAGLLNDSHGGPMLEAAFSKFDGQELVRPNRPIDWPSPNRLSERFAEFQKQSGLKGDSFDMGAVDIARPSREAEVNFLNAPASTADNRVKK